MATSLKSTPYYQDQLMAWHNQRIWRLLLGSGALNAVLIVALCIVTLRPHGAPYVVAVSKQGDPLGTILPFADRQPITDNVIREIALPIGLVDVKVAAIDHDWSGLRLVWRTEHRRYLGDRPTGWP